MLKKKVIRFLKKNYLLIALAGFIIIICGVGIVKFFGSSPKYVYVRMKVGQGYWWANTLKPSLWYSESVRKGDKAIDLIGKPVAEVLEVRRYPTNFTYGTQYDTYVKLRLEAKYNNKSGLYTFDRTNLSVGAPIQLQFPKSNITGTIIEFAEIPFKDVYVEKIVYAVNQGGFTKDFPYRYDNLPIGDTYNDGEENVLQIMDKQLEKSIWAIANNLNAQIFERDVEATQNIIVKMKIKVKKEGDGYYYGFENKVAPNLFVPLATDNYYFEGFTVRRVE